MRAVRTAVAVLGLLLVATGCAVRPGATKPGGRATDTVGSSPTNYCDRTQELTATQQDRLLRFTSVVRDELAAIQGDAVLISRSGLDLSRFEIRYSHAAVALRSDNGIWSVRQLYYACDEGRPRLYDQGMAGFVMGTEDPALGYISIVTLPKEAAQDLHRAALDRPRALRLLASHYSANAYAFGLAYQNCNQWVVEMLATAWGDLSDGEDLRARAQHWLMRTGYTPEPVDIGSAWLMVASVFVPLVHLSDHPEDDRVARKLRISLPTTVEKFVQDRYPSSRRIEICHDGTHAVVHRGWESVREGCRPAQEDRIVQLGT